jgi:hypothetical protein
MKRNSPYLPTADSSEKSSTHTQCLLNFINAFKKPDLFILGTLVVDATM